MRRIFSATEKHQIMKKYIASGLNVPSYSRESGVSESTLYKWRQELGSKGVATPGNNIQEFVEFGTTSNLYYEIRCQDVILKIPGSESISSIAAIFKQLSAC